jgi:hypothetical protein
LYHTERDDFYPNIFQKHVSLFCYNRIFEANSVYEIDTRRSIELSGHVSVGAEVPDKDAGQ